ncbi:ankyrin repeat-containing domain protein [Aspergillus insuetus]
MANLLEMLPEELILEIAQNSTRESLAAFVGTSKNAWRIGHPILYVMSREEQQRVFKWAGDHGQERTMSYILNDILEQNRTNAQVGYEALISACRGGCAKIVSRLLSEGVKPDSETTQRRVRFPSDTPLTAAISNSHMDIIQMLIKAKANLNRRSDGNTPMISAARVGNVAVIELLLEDGASPAMRCGDTCPLLETAGNGHLAATKVLLAADADVNAEIGHTCALMEATRGGHIEIMKTLLQAGASTKTTFQWSHPLSVASMLGNLEAMRILIDAGADVNPHAMGEDPPLPLWEATKNNHVDAVLLLVESGGTECASSPWWFLSEDDGKFSNLPFVAATFGSIDVLRLFMSKGFDINILGQHKRSVLSLAAENGHTDCVNFLLDKGADIVQALLKKGAKIHISDKNNHNPLHWAASSNKAEAIKALLAADTSGGTSLQQTRVTGETPLMLAIAYGCEEAIKVLVADGTSIHQKDATSSTPVIVAAKHLNHDAARLLLERGADPGAADNEGRTALMHACWRGTTEVARVLLEKECDVYQMDDKGRNAHDTILPNAPGELREMIVDAMGLSS